MLAMASSPLSPWDARVSSRRGPSKRDPLLEHLFPERAGQHVSRKQSQATLESCRVEAQGFTIGRARFGGLAIEHHHRPQASFVMRFRIFKVFGVEAKRLVV